MSTSAYVVTTGAAARPGPDPAARGDRLYDAARRAFDALAAALLLVGLAPVMAAVALLVKASGPGPVVYTHRRLGRSGREFPCYKFRTMVAGADAILRDRPDLLEEFAASYKIKEDPRVTRVGAFLRKTSLDELPQLVNVLRGDVSLIGPRPIVRDELARYGPYADLLLSVKPGVSGYWQVYGRSDTTYPERVSMDVSYIANRSPWLDLKLAALTAVVVLTGRGAY